MEITEIKTGEVLTVALKGRLDAASSNTVEKRLREVVQSGERWMVLDLEQLDYISSIGLRVFMVTAKRLKTSKGAVVVCTLKATIQQVFDISGFGKIFRIFESRDAAIAGLVAAAGGGTSEPKASARKDGPSSDGAVRPKKRW